ncbi:MAG: hypothetical protein WC710_13500 [Gallionella sp.]|jgi:hypothetical protein
MNRYQARKASGVETIVTHLDKKTAVKLTKRAASNKRSRAAELAVIIKAAVEA